MSSKTEYFASQAPDKLAADCQERVKEFDQHVEQSGRRGIWQRSFSYYNRGIYKDGRLNRVGEQGEYTEIYINHFRNLLTHILNMTTNQRPSFDARATNSDFKSQAQTIIGNNILDYYNRVKGLDSISKTAVEDCLQFADGYIYQGWDFTLGDPYMPDPNQPGKIVKQGDVIHKNYTPMDVIFDFRGGMRSAAPQWYILRDYQNKWDLVQRFPEMREKILAASNDSTLWQYAGFGTDMDKDTDYIPVFIFLHDRTEAVANGRYFTYLSKECWFVDSGLPKFYKKLPVYKLCGSQQRGSGFGYSIAFDLLAIQEAIDGLYSTVITNQITFGVQNITIPKGSDIGVTEISEGLNVMSYDSKLGKPEALNLCNTPKEIFEFLQMLENVMQTISGINSVSRGNPEANLKSGSALALVQSMAIQFISGLQQSYAVLLEDLGTGLINIMKECANTPRMVEIAGKNNKPYMKEFTGQDLSNVNRVTVDMGNPISRTTAGKVAMADSLLSAKLIENPQQYLQVMTTGKLEPLIEGKQAELMLIRSENEALSSGAPVSVTAIDNHTLHILEHKSVLASAEARTDAKVVKAVLDHVQQHLQLWRSSDPGLLQILQEPLPPAPVLPPIPGQAPSPSGSPARMLDATDPAQAKAATVRMPNMPKNPLTKEPALAANGGT